MARELTSDERKKIVDSIEHLFKESKVANAKIEYSYALERLQRKNRDLEERVEIIETVLLKLRDHFL